MHILFFLKWSSILNFLAYMCTLLHTCAHVRRKILSAHLGAALAIDTSGDDATSIAGTLATREETFKADMHQRVAIADDADGTGGARLDTNHHSLIGQETMTLATECLETFLQTMADRLRHPEMQG